MLNKGLTHMYGGFESRAEPARMMTVSGAAVGRSCHRPFCGPGRCQDAETRRAHWSARTGGLEKANPPLLACEIRGNTLKSFRLPS